MNNGVDPVRSLARADGASPEDLGEATSNGVDMLCGFAIMEVQMASARLRSKNGGNYRKTHGSNALSFSFKAAKSICEISPIL